MIELQEQFRELRVAFFEGFHPRTPANREKALDELASNPAVSATEDGAVCISDADGVPIVITNVDRALEIQEGSKDWFNCYYVGKSVEYGQWFWDMVTEGATQKFLESARILTTKVDGERVQFTPLPGAIRVILYGSPYPEGLPGEEGKQTVH